MSDESIYSIQIKTINGEQTTLAPFKDKALLIVNVASKCGFTPQYEGLEQIYREFKNQGLEILGFPCNQFGEQEPGDENEIKTFCDLNYKISFPMFAKVDVNGDNTHPLFQYLKKQGKGVFGTESIKWNFTKFLINRKGEVLNRYAPTTKPESLVGDIKSALEDK